MDQLIRALQIFLKYQNPSFPTHCEHDVLMVVGITKDEVSEKDVKALGELGFFWSDEYDCWNSYKFGSA